PLSAARPEADPLVAFPPTPAVGSAAPAVEFAPFWLDELVPRRALPPSASFEAAPPVEDASPVTPPMLTALPPLASPDSAFAPFATEAASPESLPPVLPPLPPTATFFASPDELPPVDPPFEVVSPEALPDVVAPTLPASPPEILQPACLHVSAEPPLASPLELRFEFLASPPVPVPAPPVASPPLALARPLRADAFDRSTVPLCVPFTVMVIWGGGGSLASAVGITT